MKKARIRIGKKIVPLVLSFAMMLSLCVVNAAAGTDSALTLSGRNDSVIVTVTPSDDHVYYKVQVVNGSGTVVSDPGHFDKDSGMLNSDLGIFLNDKLATGTYSLVLKGYDANHENEQTLATLSDCILYTCSQDATPAYTVNFGTPDQSGMVNGTITWTDGAPTGVKQAAYWYDADGKITGSHISDIDATRDFGRTLTDGDYMMLQLFTAYGYANDVATITATPAGKTTYSTAEKNNVAKIGNTEYETLAEAVSAAQGGDTITLLNSVSGSGVKVAENSQFTIDLNGNTYTVTNPTVGSIGTETNGFQLLKGSEITFKNGTIKAGTSKILLQNYCNLTLENVTLDCSEGDQNLYALSNNFGNVTIKGNTNIIAREGQRAFDLWYGLNSQGLYDEGVTVTFDNSFTGSVSGIIEYGCQRAQEGWQSKTILNINGSGTFTGPIEASSADALNGASINISSGTFSTLDALKYLSNNANITVRPAENTIADVAIPVSTTVTLDLNGKTLTNSSDNTITNHGTLTITGEGTVDNVSHAKAALKNEAGATATLNGGAFTRSKENGQSAESSGGNSFYNIQNYGTMTINDGVSVTQTGNFSSLLENGYYDGTGKTNTPTLTINGGTFSGGLNTIKNDDCAELTINGGTFTNVTQNALMNWNVATVNGGTFVCEKGNAVWCGWLNDTMDKGQLTITAGNFTGAIFAKDSSAAISITGGYFTTDPSAYVADGKVAGTSDNAGYAIQIKDAIPGVVVKPAHPAVNEIPDDAPTMTNDEKTVLNTAANGVSVDHSDTGLRSTAGDVAGNVTNAQKQAATTALTTAGVSTEGQTVTVVIEPKLEVTPIAYNDTSKELTLDIKAKYDTIATTDPTNIDLDGENKNAAKVGETKTLTVDDGTPVVISAKIPEAMVTAVTPATDPVTYNDLTIKHVKENGSVYYYTATVTKEGEAYYATFTVMHGFSDFTLMAADTRKVTVSYSTTGSTVATPQTYSVTDVGTTLPTSTKSGYTFKGWTFNDMTGTYTTLPDFWMGTTGAIAAKSATAQFSYNGGSSGGGISSYTLTFDVNGGSAISRLSKISGTTVDLESYKPTRDGYTFAGWFSDKDLNKSVTSVKLTANTTVYAKWIEKSDMPFTDVSASTYYFDAVKWAASKGVTSGTNATEFEPNAICTRAQTVTFLWRAMGSPEPASSVNLFTDVKADAYYYKAVLWAVEKGITKGTSDTTFSPDATVTRSQTVTFLYRAAGNPTAGTTNPFTDVNADAYYASAVLWAVKEGITSGTTATTFSPDEDCTRAQIVTLLYRYLGK